MTEKERNKIWELKGQPAIAIPGIDLANKVDKNAVVKVLKRELRKHFGKNGFQTDKDEWSINFKVDYNSWGTISLHLKEGESRTYALLVPFESILSEWSKNDKTLFATMKKDKREMFVGVVQFGQVGNNFSFKEILSFLEQCLIRAGRASSIERDDEDRGC